MLTIYIEQPPSRLGLHFLSECGCAGPNPGIAIDATYRVWLGWTIFLQPWQPSYRAIPNNPEPLRCSRLDLHRRRECCRLSRSSRTGSICPGTLRGIASTGCLLQSSLPLWCTVAAQALSNPMLSQAHPALIRRHNGSNIEHSEHRLRQQCLPFRVSTTFSLPWHVPGTRPACP